MDSDQARHCVGPDLDPQFDTDGISERMFQVKLILEKKSDDDKKSCKIFQQAILDGQKNLLSTHNICFGSKIRLFFLLPP